MIKPATIAQIYKKLHVYMSDKAITLEPPTGGNLRDYVADQFGIEPMYEDRELSDEQTILLDDLMIELTTYVKRQIVFSNDHP